jgi:DNA-binding transcriptional ArsR family regulator
MTMNKVFKALADPTRRHVLELLRQKPMTAGELSDHFPVSKPTMSAHFSVLQGAGLVDAEKSGRVVLYRLKISVLEDALLGFAEMFGLGMAAYANGEASRPVRKKASLRKREA